MSKTLEMVFTNGAGRDTKLNLANPKESLTLAEVKPVMELIIARNVFATEKSGALMSIKEARIKSSDIQKLA